MLSDVYESVTFIKNVHASELLFLCSTVITILWFKKNAPTLADYNYEPVQSIVIIFSKLFVNDHKSCLVVTFSTSPNICCHYTLRNTMLYFALIIHCLSQKMRQLRITITSISVKEL